MKQMLISLFLFAACARAEACSVMMFPPESEFSRSEIVVMARPVGVSFRPKKAASLRFTGEFRETVMWEVLLSWKGKWQSGDRFTTRRTFEASPCNYEVRLTDRSTYLLYGYSKTEPYKYFLLVPAAQSNRYMQHLSERIKR
jgi:hypothetical protein